MSKKWNDPGDHFPYKGKLTKNMTQNTSQLLPNWQSCTVSWTRLPVRHPELAQWAGQATA